MEENFSPDIYTLSDDEGNEYTFEALDEMELEGERYIALQPVYDDPKKQLDDSGELVIMRSVSEGEDEYFEEIENEELFDRVASIFTTRLDEAFNIEQ